MSFSLRRTFQLLLIALLSLAVGLPSSLFAQDHVVSSADLRKDVQAVTVARNKSLQQLDDLLSSPQGQQALETVHVSYQQVQKAVASLDDADLARLSARAQAARNDFAAGRITDRDLIWILIGVAVVILIVVAVR
jgi:cellobiose-specific phosphotransferase system component IIB